MSLRITLSHVDLVTTTWGEGSPAIVMLHDGLGSIELWRDIPRRVAEQTGATVMAYDRSGHGSSKPSAPTQWPPNWMSQEADVLAELLSHLGTTDVILVGHSDGASIALLHASAGGSVAGVLALAPHSYVEQRCVDAIAAMRDHPKRTVAALARYHDDPEGIFDAWSRGWTNPEFASWDIRDQLSAISAPALIVQGVNDEYATPAMVRSTAESIGANAEWRLLNGVGHLLHRDDPDLVVNVAADFVAARLR